MELWTHQKEAIELGKTKDLALLYPPGTGKTRTMIEILRYEYNQARDVIPTLIICPLSVCSNWKAEFQKFSNIPEDRILVLTGTGKSRVKAMAEMRRPSIIVTNFAAVQIQDFYRCLKAWHPQIVIIDECHNLKNSEGVRTKLIYPLCDKARRRFIMTGTLVPNSLLDIFGQFKALDPGVFGDRFWSFRTKYFYDRNAGMPAHLKFPDWQPLPDASKKIAQVIADRAVQARKEDCIDLPPLLEVKIPVDLGKDQGRAYESMATQFVAEMDGVTSIAEFAMTKGMRLQQILMGFLAESSSTEPIWFKENPRLQALEDLLENIHKEKAIIWTIFQPTYRKLGELCTKMGLKYGFLTGEQTIKQKTDTIRDFQEGTTQVVIAHPAAASEGINLFAAPYAIYYGKGYSNIHFEQSKARNHRGGSNMHPKVTHYHLESTGTLDQVISDALLNKKEVGEQILAWCRMNRKVMEWLPNNTLDTSKSVRYLGPK